MEALSLTSSDLMQERAAGRFPIVIDVRRPERYAGDSRIIQGAIRRRPDTVADWGRDLRGQDVVVYCVFGHEVSQEAAAALRGLGIAARYLEGGIETWRAAYLPEAQKPPAQPSRWITRARPKIDRIACPWLIWRFIEPEAEIHYVPAAEVAAEAARLEATPFDIPNAAFSHTGDDCSFDAFLKHYYLLADPALKRLAPIIRGADTGQLALAPEAPGLLALSLGLSAKYNNDHAMLDAALPIYDALYARAASVASEAHGWPPQS